MQIGEVGMKRQVRGAANTKSEIAAANEMKKVRAGDIPIINLSFHGEDGSYLPTDKSTRAQRKCNNEIFCNRCRWDTIYVTD